MILELSLAAALTCSGGIDCVRGLARHRPTPAGPTALERWALSAAAAPGMDQLRAGAPLQEGASVLEDERAVLAAAQQSAPGLDQQRAGDLTDREVAIIAITAAVILLLIIIF